MTDVAILALGAIAPPVLRAVGDSMLRNLELRSGRPLQRDAPQYAYSDIRDQYDAVSILRSIGCDRAVDAPRVIGVTDCDLFIPMLRYVYGLAQLEGRAALVSLARLRQEYYQLPPDDALLLERARKEVVHELGHSLGLVHCDDRSCVMSVSTSLELLDGKGEGLCRTCGVMFHERAKRLLSGPGERLRGG